jgi:hypothetical protein
LIALKCGSSKDAISNLPDQLNRLYAQHTRSRTTLKLDDFIPILQAVALGFEAIYLVFDAIDEVEQKQLPEIIRLLERIRMDIANAKFLLMSRPHLEPLFTDTVKVILTSQQEDLRRFLQFRLDSVSVLSGEQKNEIIQTLLRHEQPMYIRSITYL